MVRMFLTALSIAVGFMVVCDDGARAEQAPIEQVTAPN